MKNLITFGDKRFLVVRILREDSNPIIDTWKEHLRADTVLKKDGIIYFCQETLETEILEEWTGSESEMVKRT